MKNTETAIKIIPKAIALALGLVIDFSTTVDRNTLLAVN